MQFDVVLANLPRNHKGVCGNTTKCLGIFALSTGGPSEVFHTKKAHYIVLKDVKGVPVVIYYDEEAEDFDKFELMAKKVLESVEWTGT